MGASSTKRKFPKIKIIPSQKRKLNFNLSAQEEKVENNIETMKIVLNTKLPPPKKWNEEKIWSFGYHKTLLGYLNAFFDHCPIKVNPNIIWQLILNAFSNYVDENSNYESFRKKFVNFNGKKNLICIRIGSFKDLYLYEKDVIEEFCQKISENIGNELVDILTPNFTTSTTDTIIAGKVSIMSAFRKYFNYHMDFVSCGIPYIILEGTLEDWEKILQKLEFLKKYDFYIEKMKKNIREIIETKKGNINYDFWRNIIMETKETITEYVECSKENVEKELIRGWLCDFYPSMKSNPQKNDLVDEVLEAPVQLMQIETGEKRNAIIYTGIRDLKQDPETFIIEPIVNYCFSLNGHHHL